jgi:hypothetical protein
MARVARHESRRELGLPLFFPRKERPFAWPLDIAAVDTSVGVTAWALPVVKVVAGGRGSESFRDKTQAVRVSCPLLASSKQAVTGPSTRERP